MKKRGIQHAYWLLLLIISSCVSKKEILPGFVMYNSLNDMDSPGGIYRIGQDNKTVRLVEYRDNTPAPNPIQVSNSEKSKVINIKTLLSFLSNGDTTIVGSLGVNSKKNIKINIKIVQGQLYKMTDEDMKIYNKDLRKRLIIDTSLPENKPSMYFILREAVSAKEIYLDLRKLPAIDSSYKEKIRQVTEGRPNIVWLNSNEIKISLKEDELVFYKTDRILLVSDPSGNAELKFEPLDPKSTKLLNFEN
ncbi:hypothetical protein [Mucilaginibacter lappiensis]|jgi:hypothetical protein|uniref:hypothetical protein n=1 Tax=Mucilaginibacter lappiensis TaxID=354630 RepID=UPI003D2462E5